MDSAEELQSYINKLQLAVDQGRHKLLHSDGAEVKTEVSYTPDTQTSGTRTLMYVFEIERKSFCVSAGV